VLINITTSPELDTALFVGTTIDLATGKICEITLLKVSEGPDLNHISVSIIKIGQLVQRVGTYILKGTNTIFFVPHDQKSVHKKATYIHRTATGRIQKRKRV
jgi:hypothetical protein